MGNLWRSEGWWIAPVVGGGGGTLTPPTVTNETNSTPGGSTATLNVGAGDWVIVTVSGYAHTAPISISGATLGAFTPIADVSVAGQVLAKRNTGGALTGETLTITAGSATSFHVLSVAGADPVSPFDGSMVSYPDPTLTSSGIPIPTSVNGALIVAHCEYGSPDSSPWTSNYGNAYGDVISYRQVTTAGTYTPTFGGTSGSAAIGFALKGI